MNTKRDDATLAELKTLTESFGGSWHTLTGDNPAETLLEFARTSNAAQLVIGASNSPWYMRLLGPGVSGQIIAGAGDIDVHIVSDQKPSRQTFPRSTRSSLALSRKIFGWILAVLLPIALTIGFLWHGDTSDTLIVNVISYIAAEVAVALVGGWWPAIFAALAGSLLVNWFFIPPVGGFTISAPENLIALVLSLLVGAGVARVVDVAARRAAEAKAASAHALLMSELAGSVVHEGSNIPGLLTTICETFGVPYARLQERDAQGQWVTQYASGTLPDREPSADEAEVFELDQAARLQVAARPLSASEHQTMVAYAGRILALARQRELNKTRLEAQRLQAANAVRTTLLTAVSHDLRTPLASIKTAVSGLRMADVELPPDLQQELLKNIEDSTDRLDRIVSDLLHMSRIHTGTLEVNSRVVDVAGLIDSALDSMEPSMIPEDLSINVQSSLPAVQIDPGLAERIIANLVHNAHKYGMPPISIDAS